MAVIEQRKAPSGAVSYRARVRKAGHEESASFQRKRDAETWARQLEADIDAGKAQPAVESKRHTLAEAIKRFEDDRISELRSAKDVRRLLRWWSARLGKKKLFNLTTPVISAAKSDLRRGVLEDGTTTLEDGAAAPERSAGTVNRYLAALSTALAHAQRELHWIQDNPVRSVKKLKEPEGRVRYLSDDERERLFAACRNSASPDLLPLVALAITTGARAGEIRHLRWPQVDLEGETVQFLHTKNGHPRSVGLVDPALTLFRQRAQGRKNVATLHGGDLVFASSDDPEMPLEFRKAFVKALRKAKIRDFRFHDLRHCAASYLAQSGATLPEIAGVLGHRTMQVVQRYAHLSKPHTVAATQRMAAKFFGG